jgi:pyruvate/2-oxoglutarate/acetoin dehydrogenase E1 component
VNALERLSEVIAELLAADPRRILLGEDVRDGGMLGLSRRAVADPTLAPRVVGTPLGPTVAIAHAAGLAAAGARPILILAAAQGLVDGFAALREAALLRWRSGDRCGTPLLILAPSGPGFGTGGDAGHPVETLLMTVPGLRVAVAGEPLRLAGALRTAAQFDEAAATPVVLLLPRALLLRDLDEPEGEPAPLGPRIVREGAQATVFAWGATVERAVAAADAAGIEATIVDVGDVSPLELEVLVDRAARTGRIVLTHAGPRHGGPAAELAAVFADAALLRLEAPILRVCGSEGPSTPSDEWDALPTTQAIAAALREVAHY